MWHAACLSLCVWRNALQAMPKLHGAPHGSRDLQDYWHLPLPLHLLLPTGPAARAGGGASGSNAGHPPSPTCSPRAVGVAAVRGTLMSCVQLCYHIAYPDDLSHVRM